MAYVAVVYVGMGVFLLIISILCGTLIPAMLSEGSVQTAGPAGFGGGGGMTRGDIIPVFFLATLIQSVGMGTVTGVFEDGTPIAGIKHICIMSLITWIIFKFLVGM